mgnify:CR=1 FL=1
MNEKISSLQLSFIIANLIFTTMNLSLPLPLVQMGEQHSWFVPIITFPIIVVIILIGFGKKKELEKLQVFFAETNKNFFRTCFFIVAQIFLVALFLKDFRAIIDLITNILLPMTPNSAVAIVLALTLIYMATGGLEVISRVTTVQFIIIGVTISLLPLLLLNEISYDYLQPFGGMDFVDHLGKSSYLFTPWVGEAVLVFLLFTEVGNPEKIKMASIIGVGIGLGLFVIILLLSITVLGLQVLKEVTYPSITLIQHINITDFLDRLDLSIVTLWLPTYFAKLALILYCLNKTICLQSGKHSNLLIMPIGVLLGVLSIVLFTNNLDHLEYSFFTWATLGLILEFTIFLLFFIIRVKNKSSSGLL